MTNLWIILFAAAVSQGYFLSLSLGLKERWANPATNLMSLLILAFSITLTYYLTFWLGLSKQLPSFTSLVMQFTLLFGPLLWMYFQKSKGAEVKRIILHFSPFIVAIVALTATRNTSIFRPTNFAIIVLQNVQLVIYSALFLSVVREKSFRPLAYTFAGYSACFITYYILAWSGNLRLEHDYFVSLGMAIFIYYIGYSSLKSTSQLPDSKNSKYTKSSLTENALAYIINKLDKEMESEKLFLNGNLKLQSLANHLEVSSHSLSQAINTGKKQKFNDYLNELRVEEAQRLMNSSRHRDLKLIAIAIDSGFNNKTSFLNAFKKHTGLSPSEYREKLLAQAS